MPPLKYLKCRCILCLFDGVQRRLEWPETWWIIIIGNVKYEIDWWRWDLKSAPFSERYSLALPWLVVLEKNIWSNANNEFYILCSSPCKPAPKKPLLWQQVMFSPALLWKEPSHLLNAAAGGKNVGANGFFATYPSINDHTFQSPPQSCASELGVWSKFVIKISFASIFNHWMVD